MIRLFAKIKGIPEQRKFILAKNTNIYVDVLRFGYFISTLNFVK